MVQRALTLFIFSPSDKQERDIGVAMVKGFLEKDGTMDQAEMRKLWKGNGWLIDRSFILEPSHLTSR